MVKDQLAKTREERDKARRERDKARQDRDKAREERDLFRKERDQLLERDMQEGWTGGMIRGRSFEAVATAQIRELHAARRRGPARALAQAFLSAEGYEKVGALMMGIYLAIDGHHHSAAGYFGRVPEHLALEHAPYEYAVSLLSSDEVAAEQRIREHAEASVASGNVSRAFRLVKALLKQGRTDAAQGVVVRLGELPSLSDALSGAEMIEFRWMQKVMAERAVPVGPEACDILFGLMDYKLLSRDRSSGNVGDYVQTLAAFGNLARHDRVQIVSDEPGLRDLLVDLKARIRPEDRVAGGEPVRVGIVPVDRDFATGRQYRRPVWFISNGWFMHSNERGVFDFPYPEGIRPIFVSFHVNNHNMLTPEAIGYLKRHEPIGCRDWTTVYRLMDVGVEAFFSGCLTTTVGLLFEPPPSTASALVANVEAKLTSDDMGLGPIEDFIQLYDDVRDYSLSKGLDAAIRMLEGYRKFGTIITSRLHCFLPCRSIGMKVDFRPRSTADVRFDGLGDLDGESFARVRKGLEQKLERVLGAVLDGASEEAVRRLWAEICAEDVAAARDRIARAPALPPTTIDVPGVSARLIRDSRTYGAPQRPDALEVAFSVDENLAEELKVTIASLLQHADAPVTVSIMGRDLPGDYGDDLARLWPETHFRLFDFSGLTYGDVKLLKHTSVATMDRLFLPEIVPQASRILYLDVDILVRKDVSPLFRLDMSPGPIAGRPTTSEGWKTGTGLLELKARQQGNKAAALRLWAYSGGRVAFQGINAGVLVLDTERLRASGFVERTLAMVQEFGFHDQDAINFFIRGDFVPLETAWNFVPSQDYCEDPAIVHWAGPDKPWQQAQVLYKDEYKAIAASLAQPAAA